MNLRLEELRRRLLEPGALPTNNKTVYQRSSLLRRESGEVVEVALADNPPHVPSAAEIFQEIAAAEEMPVPESVSAAVLQYLQQNPPETEPQEAPLAAEQYQLAQAVAKVFDQTRAFEESLGGLQNMLDPMKQAGAALASLIEPLRSLEQQILELADAFDSMQSFQSQLTQLAESFEPMRGLEQQVVQFSQAFGIHLTRLNRSLYSARVFRSELVQLVQSLEPVEAMQGRFSELIEACNPKPVMS